MKMNKKLSFALIVMAISLCLITAASATDVNDTIINAENDINHANEEILEVSNEETSSSNYSLNATVLGENGNDNSASLSATADEVYEIESNLTENILGKSTAYDSSFAIDLDNVKEGGTLYLSCDYILKDFPFTKNNITVDGRGNVISGDNLRRIFTIDADYVTFKNVIFTGGYNRDVDLGYGGAIRWKGNYGQLINCTFIDNNLNKKEDDYNDVTGGAVLFYDNNNKVINCTFINNAGKYGNALYFDGRNNLVDGCTFTNNSCISWTINIHGKTIYSYMDCFAGGAIYVNGKNNTIKNSFFDSNWGRDGAAIYINSAENTVDNCIFIHNRLYREGTEFYRGAVYIDSSDCKVVNSSFLDNGLTSASDYRSDVYATSKARVEDCWFGTARDSKPYSVHGECELVNWYGLEIVDYSLAPDIEDMEKRSAAFGSPTLFSVVFVSNDGQKVVDVDPNLIIDVISFEPGDALVQYGSCNLSYDGKTTEVYYEPVQAAQGKILLEIFSSPFGFLVNHTAGSTFTDLNRICGSNESTITLNQNYTYHDLCDDSFKEGIAIRKNLTIDANGYTIDGQNTGGLFDIKLTYDVTLTIMNANLVNLKKAFKNYGNLVLINSTISYSKSSFTNYGNIVLINSTVINDQGTLFNSKKILYGLTNPMTIKLINSSFFDIKRAISEESSNQKIRGRADIIIENCTFQNVNELIYRAKSAEIHNSEFDNIKSRVNVFGTLNITDSIFLNSNIDDKFESFDDIVYMKNNWYGNTINDYEAKLVESEDINDWIILNAAYDDNGTGIIIKLNQLYDAKNERLQSTNGLQTTLEVTVNNQPKQQVTMMNGEANIDIEGSAETKHVLLIKCLSKEFTLVLDKGTTESFTKLKEIIEETSTGVITLSRNYTYNETVDYNITEGIIIDKFLTIDGNGYTLDCGGKTRAFIINADNVTIQNLKIINGCNTDMGGAIYWNATNGCLNNSMLENNTASKGGAIYINDRRTNVLKSIIVNNNASVNGGGIYVNGTDCNITDCILLSNSANAAVSHIYATESVFTKDNWYGNTIDNIDIAPSGISENVNVDSWKALDILFENGTPEVSFDSELKMTIVLKDKATINVSKIEFAIPFNASSTNSTVSPASGDVNQQISYSPTSGNSGTVTVNVLGVSLTKTIEHEGISPLSKLEKIIANNTIIDMGEDYNYYTFDHGITIDHDVTINGNGYTIDGLENGEFIFNITEGANVIIKNLTITCTTGSAIIALSNSSSDTLDLIDCNFIDASSALISQKQTTIVNCLFENLSGDEDSAVILYGDESYANIISNSTFVNNGETGAVEIYSPTTVSNSKFLNNYGTSVFVGTDNCAVENCEFIENYAGDYAAGIYVDADNCIVSNSVFINNSAYYDGGAIFWKGKNGKIMNSVFINNTAKNGGAISIDDESVLSAVNLNTTVFNSTFENNKADSYGGAIYVHTNNITVDSARFIGNDANYGGAVYIDRENDVIVASYFENNTAAYDGGAVYWNDNDGLIEASKFTNNAARDGGALYINDDRVKVDNSTFTQNRAVRNGGALYVDKSILSSYKNNDVLNSIFENNTAAGDGGAIYWKNKESTLNNTIFIGNTAVNGGALYNIGDDNVIVKSIFINNTATSQASAIYVKEDSTTIQGNVFLNNNGNVIYYKDSTWILTSKLNVDYNWFGNNETNYNQAPTLAEDITCNKWYFLNMTMKDGEIAVTLNNLYDAETGKVSADANYKLPVLTFKLTSENITVVDEVTLENGMANINYTPVNAAGFLTASYDTSMMTKIISNVTTDLVDCEEFEYGKVTIEYEVLNPNEVEITITDADGVIVYSEVGNGTVIKPDLALGNYTIVILNKGNDVISSSNATRNFSVVKATPVINVSSSDVIYPEVVTVSVTSDVNGTYTFKFGDIIQEIELTANVAQNITLNPKEGSYLINVTYNETDNYNSAKNDSVTVNVFKNVSPISAIAEVNKTKVLITATVNENMTGFVSLDLYDTPIYIPIVNGTATLALTLNPGAYEINIKYPGNDEYAENSTLLIFTVPEETKENTTITLNVNINENNATFIAKVDERATGLVKFDVIGEEEYTLYANVDNGQAILEDILKAGNYTVVATYTGNDWFNSNITYKEFTIVGHIKKDTQIEANYNIINNQVTVTVTVDENATGFVRIQIEDTIANIELENGIGQITTTLPAGSYNLDITYLGDYNYNKNNTKLSFTITEASKKNTTIDLDISINENNVTFKVNVNETAKGFVKFQVTGSENYTLYADVTKGVAILEDSLKTGNYTVTATYMGDSIFNTNITSKDFEVKGHVMKDTPITAEIKTNANKVTLTVTVDDAATGFVRIQIEDTIANIELENGKGTLTTTLPYGSYNMDITYLGDANYNKNSTKREFTLIEPTKENTPISINIETNENNATITANVNEDATGIVKFEVSGQEEYTLYVDIVNGKATLKDVLAKGDYTVIATYMGSDKYNTNITSKDFTILGHIKKDTPINAEVKINGNKVTISVTVDEDATGFVKIKIGDTIANIQLTNGKGSLVQTLTEGSYYADITYLGDDNYNQNSTKLTFTVVNPVKENTPITIDVDVTENEVTFTVNVDSDATGIVKFEVIGAETYTLYVDVVDGKAVLTDILDAGDYLVFATYMGDSRFNSNVTSSEFTITEKQDANITINVPGDIKAGDEAKVDITLPEDATGNVIVLVDGKQAGAMIVSGGNISVPIGELTAGEHIIEVRYSGDADYKNATSTIDINIPETEPKDPNLQATATNNTIDITVDEAATGYVLVDVDGQGYYAPIKDGKASIDVIGLDAGTYQATVTYVGDDVYRDANTTVSVTVPKKEDPKPEPVDPKAKIEITNTTVTASLPSDATGYVLVDVDGQGYYAPVKDGKATIELPELAPGNHTVTVTYTGDAKYASANASKVITVEEEKETIIAEDLTKIEKSADRFVAKFTDKSGNPLANTKVTFEINGGTYTRTTDENGQASFAINLVAGNYTIISRNPVTGESKENKITVVSRFAENNDLTKYFRNASQYVIKVLGDDGKPAAAGEVVTFNINGVFYNRTVNATGHVKLNINLNPGDYIITAEYKGCKISNNIKVLPVLTGKDLTKKYGVAGQFEATLVDGQGNAYANQRIEFNINGVFYYRTTDSNGIARLNINLQPGEYIITSTYGQAAVSNKVTVTA